MKVKSVRFPSKCSSNHSPLISNCEAVDAIIMNKHEKLKETVEKNKEICKKAMKDIKYDREVLVPTFFT